MKVWCYSANQSFVEPESISFGLSQHLCYKWPENLIPVLNIKILKTLHDFCAVEINDYQHSNKFSLLSPSLPNVRPGNEIILYGVWMFNNCILSLSIISSWKDQNGILHSFAHDLDSVSVGNCIPPMSLMSSLLVRQYVSSKFSGKFTAPTYNSKYYVLFIFRIFRKALLTVTF